MRFLRTASTQRLLAVIGGVVLAIAAGTAIAVAASSGGPVPPKSSLARAVHGALSAPGVSGLSARITFTNHLIDSGDIQGTDPLLQGGTGRLWVDPVGHRLRIEVQSANGDAQVLVNNGSFWAYDPSSKTVYQGNIPTNGGAAKRHSSKRAEKVPSVAAIQKQLGHASKHLLISGAHPGDIAGQPEYTVRVAPRQNGGLVGGVALAWDALRGVPLRFAVYARGDSSPVLELKVSDISFGRVSSKVFAVSRPSTDVHVVDVSNANGTRTHTTKHGKGHARGVSGVGAVGKRLGFKLDAPSSLAGMSRQDAQLIGMGKRAGALLTYGQGLGGIAVIEEPATAAKPAGTSTSDNQHGLSIPTISVNGVTAQQLQTALGTVVRFTRAGVTYTVLGSASASTVDAAARGL